MTEQKRQITLAFLGGGQLGYMMIRAAQTLGLQSKVLDPNAASPAKLVAPLSVAPFQDKEAVHQLLQDCDYFTYEFENVDCSFLSSLPVRAEPSIDLLKISQDRFTEKSLFRELGIATAPFMKVDSQADFDTLEEKIGFPCILKTRRFGYDGKGQHFIQDRNQLAKIEFEPGKYIAEGVVSFQREVSIIAVSNGNKKNPEFAFYPLSDNEHEDAILREAAPLTQESLEYAFEGKLPENLSVEKLQEQANQIVQSVMERFSYRGILTIEFFLSGNQLLVNEMAPRVHNSGHWTIEGSVTSQFENHVRAICGLPLGSTANIRPVRMFNCIGKMPDLQACLKIEGLHVHDYHKAQRAKRKVGHLTLENPTVEKMMQVRKLILES